MREIWIYEVINMKEIIQEYLDRSPIVVNENANHNFAISGLKSHIASTVLKEFTMQQSPASEYHKCGSIHLHDSAGGPWSAYCRGLDLLQILLEGIKNPAGTSSNPAKHYDVVCDHIVNAFYVSQNEWEGAQAFSNVDTLLAGFVWNDNLTQEEVTQGMQRLIFNLSYPLRASMQTPFTNLTFDLKCPDHMKNEPVIIGGAPTEKTYGELQEEMDMVNLAFLDVMLAGDKDGNPHTFPIPTYAITKDFNWDCPVTDKLFELTSKFGLPYFMSYIGSGLDPASVRSMCCLTGDTKIISKSSKGVNYAAIKELDRTNDIKVLINGEFEPATWFKTTCDHIYEISFANGQSVKFSPDHPCITRRGEVRAEDITDDDWMPFSLVGYEGEGGSYDLGKFIGLYIAEGSHGDHGIVFSLNSSRSDLIDFVMKFASDYFGAYSVISECISPLSGKRTCVNVRIYSATIENLINEYVKGNNALDKHLSSKIFKMSRKFRQGVFDGEFLGDGSSRQRICTVSSQLAEDFCCLISSLGSVAGVTVDNRDSSCGKLSDNPLYLVRPYNVNGTRTKYKDVYEIDGDQIWIKVKNIDFTIADRSVYDFEMDTEDHIFQLANGLITHNCRLSMDLTEVVEASKGGLWNSGVDTGSLSVTTINLAQLGYLARKHAETENGMTEYFYDHLDILLDAARDHHVWKREKINEGFEMGLMPFTQSYLPNFNSFFSTIGVVGANEMCLNMWNTPIYECVEFVDEILSHIHKYVRNLTKEYGYPWNLEETPAEGCSHSLAIKDRAKYPDIITQGHGDGVFYTNSSHIYVGDEVGLGDTLRVQEKFKRHYNGGTLQHIFCGESSPNPGGAKDLIRNICTNTTIPYLALTRAYAVCKRCGVISDISGTCPTCEGGTTVFDRVTGFYRPVKSWGVGKQQEFKDRKRFCIGNTIKEGDI
jgi:ribonucleoside-triphosphate reductase